MDEIRILQTGIKDWNECFQIPKYVTLTYMDRITDDWENGYEIVILDRTPDEEEIRILHKKVKAYTLFTTGQADSTPQMEHLMKCKKGQKFVSEDEIQDFLLRESRFYFSYSYGEKYQPNNVAVSRNFHGSVRWTGKYSIDLEGEFGQAFCQIAFWRNNIPIESGQMIDLWLEYKKSEEVELTLVVTQYQRGMLSDQLNRLVFSEEDLQDIVQIDGGDQGGFLFVSLEAKGSGTLQVIALHDRHSRGTHGYFLTGGERYVTSQREELFCYFDPGDCKPPLNVYFSGYKTKQGFEGYNMMRKLGCPFLLVAEARLDGGAFYMGSKEYEKMVWDVIRRYIEELGFASDDVIFSGISMGTTGALYYGCDCKPHALILGKPLASVGLVARNEKLVRPGGFPTSLDVLLYQCNDTDHEAADRLDARFWERFDKTEWGNTSFVVSHMLEDDYESTAYENFLTHLKSDGVQVYGKGMHGRHNDNQAGIVKWFVSRYEKILQEDFARRIEKV